MAITGISTKRLQVFYSKTSNFASAVNYGDKPTVAELETADIFKQFKYNQGFDQTSEYTAIEQEQAGAKLKQNITQKGFPMMGLVLVRDLSGPLEWKHRELFQSGLGTRKDTEKSVFSDADGVISAVSGLTVTVADGTKFAANDAVYIPGKGITFVDSVSTNDVTLKKDILGKKVADTLIPLTSYSLTGYVSGTRTITLDNLALTGLAEGEYLIFFDSDGNPIEISNIESTDSAASGEDIVLKTDPDLAGTEIVGVLPYYNPTELEDDNYYHILIVDDSGRQKVIDWCKPKIDFTVEKNGKISFNFTFQGNEITDYDFTLGAYSCDYLGNYAETSNFASLYINSEDADMTNRLFTINHERVQTRKENQVGTGNAGTRQDDQSTNCDFDAISIEDFIDYYNNQEVIFCSGFFPFFTMAFYFPKVLVKDPTRYKDEGGEVQSTLPLNCDWYQGCSDTLDPSEDATFMIL